MYSKFQLSFKWLKYYMLASNRKGHGIHSPFVYELVSEVLNDKSSYYAYKKIEIIKKNLRSDNRILKIIDLGAVGERNGVSVKKISALAANAVSTEKFGRLLFRLANFYRSATIFELGSSLGISTAYLASADSLSRVLTIEGSASVSEIAKENFQQLGLKNIIQVVGNFEDVLSNQLALNPPPDLVFIDGNHRKRPVLEYFEQFLNNISSSSLIIIHDIHWSWEMEEAWAIIQANPRVKMSIDIFSAGLVFFREEFQVKQHFKIRF